MPSDFWLSTLQEVFWDFVGYTLQLCKSQEVFLGLCWISTNTYGFMVHFFWVYVVLLLSHILLLSGILNVAIIKYYFIFYNLDILYS